MRLSFLLFLLIAAAQSQAQIISTAGGNGTCNLTADGSPANSGLSTQTSLVTDDAGNIYFSEGVYIRSIDAAGILHTLAGNGEQGYTGDSGPAVYARLYGAGSMIRDSTGNIYFIDQRGTVIRRISNGGIITTITGNLPGGNSGDGGPLMMAAFGYISDIALDNSGNLYIADILNNVVRKVNASGIIRTIAGNSTAGFSGDGGPATAAKLHSPSSIVADKNGNIFISDLYNLRIRKVNAAGIISTFAGSGGIAYPGDGGPAIAAGLEEALDLAVDNDGNLYVADRMKNAVRKITPDGIISTYAGSGQSGYSGDGGAANAAQVAQPYFISMDSQDNLYISSSAFCVIRKVENCLAVINKEASDLSLCGNGNGYFVVKASNALAYQWQENAGNGWSDLVNNNIYSAVTTDSMRLNGVNILMTGYEYRCKITNACGDKFSVPALLTVLDPLQPAVITITTDTTVVCSKALTLFTAHPVNSGTDPLYQWKKNGVAAGTNAETYSDNQLVSDDVITCTLTSNSNCISASIANSNAISITVLPAPSNYLPADTSICYTAISLYPNRNFVQYNWNDGSAGKSLFINTPGIYRLEAEDENGCIGRDSVIVNPGNDCRQSIYFPNAFTPNNDGNHDFFKPVIFGNLKKYMFSIYDRFGQLVFTAADRNKAWDGKINGANAAAAVYSWSCTYQLEGRFIENKKGTVVLIR